MKRFSNWDTIILVEHDKALNYVNGRVINHLGYKGELHLLSEGNEALELLNSRTSSLDEKADRMTQTLIFIDHDMPDHSDRALLDAIGRIQGHVDEKILTVLMVSEGKPEPDFDPMQVKIPLMVIEKPLTKSALEKVISYTFRSN